LWIHPKGASFWTGNVSTAFDAFCSSSRIKNLPWTAFVRVAGVKLETDDENLAGGAEVTVEWVITRKFVSA
jgi:hypothetical protein